MLGLAALATFLWLVWAGENFRGKWAWRRLRAELEAKGERLGPSALQGPEIPEGQDFARAPLIAELAIDGLSPRTDAVRTMRTILDQPGRYLATRSTTNDGRTDLAAWAAAMSKAGKAKATGDRAAANLPDYSAAGSPGDPAAEVLSGLSGAQTALDDLCEASLRPAARYPWDLSDPAGPGWSGFVGFGTTLRSATKLLALRATTELRSGRRTAALADVRCALRLADRERAAGVLFAELVAAAMVVDVSHPVWEGVVDHLWGEPELAELQAAFADRRIFAAYARSLEGERGIANARLDHGAETRGAGLPSFESARASGTASVADWFQGLLDKLAARLWSRSEGSGEAEPWFQPLLPVFARGWIRQNQCRMNQLYQESLVSARAACADPRIPRSRFLAAQAWLASAAHPTRVTPYNFLIADLSPLLGGQQDIAVRMEVEARLIEVGCALERHRVAEGAYPQTLSALVPRFLPSVPLDPIDAQPLRYRRLNDGTFRLYSVGPDGKDDDGVLPREMSDDGYDWPWPSPGMSSDRRLF